MNYILASALALFTIVKPVAADVVCTDLCDAGIYETATEDTVRRLLETGAEVNAQDDAGKAALHWAVAAKPAVISALISAGADVNAKDKWNRTPLHFISATGSAENIRILLDAGAEVNAETANGWTPLHGAAKFGAPENVLTLLEAGADATARTAMGETPFDFGSNNSRLLGSEALNLLEAGK